MIEKLIAWIYKLSEKDTFLGKLAKIYVKYEEIITYLIVGGLTTIVSWAAMFLASWIFFGNPTYPTAGQNLVLSIVNWTAGVIFAYFTNRRYVFKSKAPMLTEIPKFVGSRVATLVSDLVIRQIFGRLGVNVYATTIISAIIVIIANYIFSKLFVFSKKDAEK